MQDFTLDFKTSPYSLPAEEKEKVMLRRLSFLTEYHRGKCPPYSRYLASLGYGEESAESLSEIPMLPVGIFKEMRLSSLDEGENFKSATSSGTSGQRTSLIILDGETRTLQQLALASIGSDFLGGKRLPMLVIDCEDTVKKRDCFSARTAGIQGFSIFGRDRTFALNGDMTLDYAGVKDFLARHEGENIFVFGFTFMVWQSFVRALEEMNETLDLHSGILIHGGGWKKLTSEAVGSEEYAERLKKVCGIEKVYDYYGMAEQTGSIFMQCECGNLHASDYSDILIRRAEDFSVCDAGESGIIEVMSVLPRSYPGHAILTEDEGVLLGTDTCPCGRKGKYFKVLGRLKNAELRGCSDTYASGI